MSVCVRTWKTDDVPAGTTNLFLPYSNVLGGTVVIGNSSIPVLRDGFWANWEGTIVTLPAGAELVTFEWRRAGVTIATHIIRAAGPDPPDKTKVAVVRLETISCRITTGATNATDFVTACAEEMN